MGPAVRFAGPEWMTLGSKQTTVLNKYYLLSCDILILYLYFYIYIENYCTRCKDLMKKKVPHKRQKPSQCGMIIGANGLRMDRDHPHLI